MCSIWPDYGDVCDPMLAGLLDELTGSRRY